jgi:HSP20 family protein
MLTRSLIPWRKNLPVQRNFDRMFDRFFNEFENFGLRPLAEFGQHLSVFSPDIDISETETEIKVVAEIPGMDEHDINVSLVNNVLTISGEKKVEHEDKGENYYHVERTYGAFKRNLELPGEVDNEHVDATYKNGILTIVMPKTAQTQTKKIEVKAS